MECPTVTVRSDAPSPPTLPAAITCTVSSSSSSSVSSHNRPLVDTMIHLQALHTWPIELFTIVATYARDCHLLLYGHARLCTVWSTPWHYEPQQQVAYPRVDRSTTYHYDDDAIDALDMSSFLQSRDNLFGSSSSFSSSASSSSRSKPPTSSSSFSFSSASSSSSMVHTPPVLPSRFHDDLFPVLPRSRHMPCDLIYNDELCLAGGSTNGFQGATNTIVSLSLTNPSEWRTWPAKMADARHSATSVVYRNQWVVCGGTNDSVVLDTVEGYNHVTALWSSWPPMTTARMEAAAVVYQDSIFIFGGRPVGGGVLDTCEQYLPPRVSSVTGDVVAGHWVEIPAIPAVGLRRGRYGHSCIVVGDCIWLLGGLSARECHADIQRYHPATRTWLTNVKDALSLSHPLHHFACTIVAAPTDTLPQPQHREHKHGTHINSDHNSVMIDGHRTSRWWDIMIMGGQEAMVGYSRRSCHARIDIVQQQHCVHTPGVMAHRSVTTTTAATTAAMMQTYDYHDVYAENQPLLVWRELTCLTLPARTKVIIF